MFNRQRLRNYISELKEVKKRDFEYNNHNFLSRLHSIESQNYASPFVYFGSALILLGIESFFTSTTDIKIILSAFAVYLSVIALYKIIYNEVRRRILHKGITEETREEMWRLAEKANIKRNEKLKRVFALLPHEPFEIEGEALCEYISERYLKI